LIPMVSSMPEYTCSWLSGNGGAFLASNNSI
jgi:hypothetical protein